MLLQFIPHSFTILQCSLYGNIRICCIIYRMLLLMVWYTCIRFIQTSDTIIYDIDDIHKCTYIHNILLHCAQWHNDNDNKLMIHSTTKRTRNWTSVETRSPIYLLLLLLGPINKEQSLEYIKHIKTTYKNIDNDNKTCNSCFKKNSVSTNHHQRNDRPTTSKTILLSVSNNLFNIDVQHRFWQLFTINFQYEKNVQFPCFNIVIIVGT